MKKKFVILIAFVIVIAGAYFLFFSKTESTKSSYEFVEIKRGDVNSIITCSGTIEPVSVVDIGTQVSGKINKILIDFNDRVHKGQLLAVLDTTFMAAAVKDSKATLEKTQAQLKEAKSKHKRNVKLYEKKYISELEFITSKTAVATAQAQVQSAKSSLERAITNFEKINYLWQQI